MILEEAKAILESVLPPSRRYAALGLLRRWGWQPDELLTNDMTIKAGVPVMDVLRMVLRIRAMQKLDSAITVPQAIRVIRRMPIFGPQMNKVPTQAIKHWVHPNSEVGNRIQRYIDDHRHSIDEEYDQAMEDCRASVGEAFRALVRREKKWRRKAMEYLKSYEASREAARDPI